MKTMCTTSDHVPSLPINNLENTYEDGNMESIGYLSNNLFDINCTGYFETSWGPFIRSDNSSCATWGGKV